MKEALHSTVLFRRRGCLLQGLLAITKTNACLIDAIKLLFATNILYIL